MAEELINISDCDEEEMRQLFQDSDVQKCDKNTNSEANSHSEFENTRTVSSQSEIKKKTPRKSNSRQRTTSRSGKLSDNCSKLGSYRKGRQSKTPSGNQGRHSRSEGDTSPCRDGLPIFTTDIHVPDNTFKLSLLDEVLTEKKMALMRSLEVKQFLKEQQSTMLDSTKKKYETSGS